MLLISCEPTYKELKQDSFRLEKIRAYAGCEPTYKELKRRLEAEDRFNGKALRAYL